MRHSTTSPAWLGTIITRRAFVKRSIVMGVAIPVMSSVLAACGSGDADDDAPAADTDAEPTATAATETPAGEPTPGRMDASAPAGTVTVAASNISPATATQPSSGAASGQLAFAGTPEGASASGIYLVNGDGSGLQPIWTWETAGSHAVYLVWSPDGRQLAFFGHDAGDETSGLYVLDVEQGSLTRLIEVGMLWYPPVWSPDGRQLYFSASSALGGGIGIVPADGSAAPTLLVSEPEMVRSMTISPDGQQIAAPVSGPPQLGVMRVDDPQMRVLVDDLIMNSAPVWSPDSQQVAFIGLSPDGIGQLYVVNADGTGIAQLTDHQPPDVVASGFAAADPVWSPDGQQIAYLVRQTDATKVYVSSVDGSETRSLSENSDDSGIGPNWSPDGREITFVSERDIRVVMADGTNPRTVVAGVQFGNFMELLGLPKWRPTAP